jgi:hypothetical protein
MEYISCRPVQCINQGKMFIYNFQRSEENRHSTLVGKKIIKENLKVRWVKLSTKTGGLLWCIVLPVWHQCLPRSTSAWMNEQPTVQMVATTVKVWSGYLCSGSGLCSVNVDGFTSPRSKQRHPLEPWIWVVRHKGSTSKGYFTRRVALWIFQAVERAVCIQGTNIIPSTRTGALEVYIQVADEVQCQVCRIWSY